METKHSLWIANMLYVKRAFSSTWIVLEDGSRVVDEGLSDKEVKRRAKRVYDDCLKTIENSKS